MSLSKRVFLFTSLSLFALFLTTGCFHSNNKQPPRDNVTLASAQGQTYLDTLQTNKTPFLTLSRYFVTQQNLAYCGVASSVMVLNALITDPNQRPKESRHKSYRYFTQDNIFSFASKQLEQNQVDQDRIQHHGMTLSTLANMIRSYNLNTQIHYASEVSVDQFRYALNQVFLRSQAGSHYILVNYGRKALGQKGGGHISPLGAYDPIHDAVLIMDVSRYKYAPVWVSVSRLYDAMNTHDSDSDRTRGYCVVSKA